MESFKEIEKYLVDIEPILIDLKIGIYNSKYLGTLEDENEIWVSKHGFFVNYVSQMKFVCSIQLCKILDDNNNQKLNYYKFLRRIESDFKIKQDTSLDNPSIQEKLFYENLEKIKKNIPVFVSIVREKLEINKEFIYKLKDSRDKIYAHTDPLRKNNQIKWQEIYNLSLIAVEIYNIFKAELTYSTLNFEMLEPWSPKWAIKRLAKTRKLK